MRTTQLLKLHRARLVEERARLDAIMNRFLELQEGGVVSGPELDSLCEALHPSRRAIVAAIKRATDMINTIGNRD